VPLEKTGFLPRPFYTELKFYLYYLRHSFLPTPVPTEGGAGPEPNMVQDMVQGRQEWRDFLTG
jgi:hypothetical protein